LGWPIAVVRDRQVRWPGPIAHERRVSGGSIDRQVYGIEIDFA
jgi:hypothetical protein